MISPGIDVDTVRQTELIYEAANGQVFAKL
jgi:hypothetical protein